MSETMEIFRDKAEAYASSETCPAWITAGITNMLIEFDNGLIKETRVTSTIKSIVSGQNDSPFATRRGLVLNEENQSIVDSCKSTLVEFAALVDANPHMLDLYLPKASKGRKESGSLNYLNGTELIEVMLEKITNQASQNQRDAAKGGN